MMIRSATTTVHAHALLLLLLLGASPYFVSAFTATGSGSGSFSSPPSPSWTTCRPLLRQSSRLFADSNNDTDSTTTTTAADKKDISTKLQHAATVMHHVMTDDAFFLQNDSLKPFHNKLCKQVQVQPSQIHGMGLFATSNIKAGTLVSFYPCHALGVDNGQAFISTTDMQDYFDATDSTASDYLHCTDQPMFARASILENTTTLITTTPVFLDVFPEIKMQRPWVSHYINDGASVKEQQNEAGVLQYYQQSFQRQNCLHIPFGPSPILATITTKKVKKGDELLTTYGGVYWGKNNVDISPNIHAQMQQSSRHLQQAMAAAQQNYSIKIVALQDEFETLWNELQ